jgi:hypothetical protein
MIPKTDAEIPVMIDHRAKTGLDMMPFYCDFSQASVINFQYSVGVEGELIFFRFHWRSLELQFSLSESVRSPDRNEVLKKGFNDLGVILQPMRARW